MELIKLIGLLSAVLTTAAFVPQALRTVKLKETRDLSLITYLLLSFGFVGWLIYGIGTRDLPLIIANSITLPLTLLILAMKLKYR